MNNPSIQTISFLFDNKTDHLLFHQIAIDGPLKRKHSGIKGQPGLLEDMNQAAIRSILEVSGLEVTTAILRGIIKTIYPENQSSVIYFVYESSKYSGDLQNHGTGRLKWVDILNVFNLEMEGLVLELMPRLLDGESFFEGTVQLNSQEEILSSDIRICNSI